MSQRLRRVLHRVSACSLRSLRLCGEMESANSICSMRKLHWLLVLAMLTLGAALPATGAQDTAEAHNQRGFAHHERRSLDEASKEYAAALALDPPRKLTAEEWQLARRFAPRLYTTPTEFFPLKDFAVILHPTERLIAYHFFWEDDIDFPEDNDPCDHELIWVRYSADKLRLENVWSYFHGRILAGEEAALADARRNGMRPRVNVQWGKHGSLLGGWETMTLKQYNEGTFRKLSTEGRRMLDHPLARRLNWPSKFTGSWNDFVNFSRLVDPLTLLTKRRMALVTRWNNATIDQHFLPYNFRPKTEWPVGQ